MKTRMTWEYRFTTTRGSEFLGTCAIWAAKVRKAHPTAVEATTRVLHLGPMPPCFEPECHVCPKMRFSKAT